MKYRINILTIIFLTTVGCADPEFSDKNIEAKALKITETLDSNNLNTFKIWNYSQRGNSGFWSKVSSDSTLYNCRYIVDHDTTFLTVFDISKFSIDFPLSYSLDSSTYYRFDFSKVNNTVRIMGTDKNGRDHILENNIEFDNIFKAANPFDTFSKLTALKDSLKVYGISYRSDIGDFIEFYLSAQHILTFIPDDAKLIPKFKTIWINEFSKGKKIRKHWNLRKLENPIDNG